jgi:hypothetical protein
VPPFQHGRGGPGGWLILIEPEIQLGEDIVVPDLAGWRRERMPALPAEPYCSVAPDWLCEVPSPSTRRLDRLRKLPVYARERVPILWLVDPEAQTIEVLRSESDRWLIAAVVGGNDQEGPVAALASGQAVVYYHIAIMSKDGNWVIREDPGACDRVLAVLAARGARHRVSPPLDVRWLAGGWSSHFEFADDRGRLVRCDFVSRPPRVTAAMIEETSRRFGAPSRSPFRRARLDEMPLREAHHAACALAERWLPVVPPGLERDHADAQ